jgi:hypothetical protein
MAKILASDLQPDPVVSPVNGALVDMESSDEKLRAYKDAEELERQLRSFKARLRDSLWSETVETESKTRHILGKRYEASIVEQDAKPNGTVLRQIIRHFPEAAAKVVVPNGYRLDKQQWKKMLATSSQCDDFNAVKNMVQEAVNSGTVPPPRITKISEIKRESSDG